MAAMTWRCTRKSPSPPLWPSLASQGWRCSAAARSPEAFALGPNEARAVGPLLRFLVSTGFTLGAVAHGGYRFRALEASACPHCRPRVPLQRVARRANPDQGFLGRWAVEHARQGVC